MSLVSNDLGTDPGFDANTNGTLRPLGLERQTSFTALYQHRPRQPLLSPAKRYDY